MEHKSFTQFFSKNCPVQSETLVAHRSKRKLYRQAYFGKLETFFSCKKVSKADCKQKANSKIIQWMIFDGTSLHLVLSEPSWYSLMAYRLVVSKSKSLWG